MPFFVGCHSAAILGYKAANDSSSSTFKPEQYEQPFPSIVRRLTSACQTCLGFFTQRHQTLALEFVLRSSKFRPRFKSCAHSCLSSGCDFLTSVIAA